MAPTSYGTGQHGAAQVVAGVTGSIRVRAEARQAMPCSRRMCGGYAVGVVVLDMQASPIVRWDARRRPGRSGGGHPRDVGAFQHGGPARTGAAIRSCMETRRDQAGGQIADRGDEKVDVAAGRVKLAGGQRTVQVRPAKRSPRTACTPARRRSTRALTSG